MFEVMFRARHDCPYVRFSTAHPEVKVVEWCNGSTDVLEIECPEREAYSRIKPDLMRLLLWRGGKIVKKTFGPRNVQIITKTCRDRCSPSINAIVEKNSCLRIPPVITHGGWEKHKVLGFKESDYKHLFKDLHDLEGKVEILSKKILLEKSIQDTFVVALGTIFSGLTEKQSAAIIAALDYGYYHTPRGILSEEIARKTGVARTTYEEHLRKAENKILHALSPYLTIYARGPIIPKTIAELSEMRVGVD
jgi:predicted DNA binding protein